MRPGSNAARRRDAISRILLLIWDPIGVARDPQARDEYDGYVGTIEPLIESGADRRHLANHLEKLEKGSMGLSDSDAARRQRTVEALLALSGQTSPGPSSDAVLDALATHRLRTLRTCARRVAELAMSEEVVEWAQRELVEGADGSPLRVLAGLWGTLDAAEVSGLLADVASEQGLKLSEEAPADYTYAACEELLAGRIDTQLLLEEVGALWVATADERLSGLGVLADALWVASHEENVSVVPAELAYAAREQAEAFVARRQS